jgi:SAM-dependent methyltransferase
VADAGDDMGLGMGPTERRGVEGSMMDTAVAEDCLVRCAATQYHHDHGTIEPLKREAKRLATDLLNQHLTVGSHILDVGGESFYHGDLAAHAITTVNLPDRDMHAIREGTAFDAVLAMHVLEHSPFPLYVLALLHRALRPDGLLYVAVPHPSPRLDGGYGHWSVLSPVMWFRLITLAGFTILEQTTGKWGERPDWVEERFLCRRSP